MHDRDKVMMALECLADGQTCACCDYKPYDDCAKRVARDVLAMLKEQDELIDELLNLGYPHNFQHEAHWVVDYLYSLTEIIKKAFKAKEGR